jgi:hypothetical protein
MGALPPGATKEQGQFNLQLRSLPTSSVADPSVLLLPGALREADHAGQWQARGRLLRSRLAHLAAGADDMSARVRNDRIV